MGDSARVVHVFVSRFNCRFVDRDFPARTQPGWLEHRFDLFERYCLPTLKAQTNPRFEWAVYFDRETPDRYVGRARDLFDGFPNFHLRFLDVYTGENLLADLTDLLAGRCDWLLSTRLDNDDGLAKGFVEDLQRAAQVGRREALNFPEGLILSEGRLYLSRQASNAFLSVSEPFADFGTALRAPHNDMGRYMPVRDLDVGPTWLQVVHESNVSNKRRGRRLPRRDLPPGFEAVPELAAPAALESSTAILAENLTLSVAWAARDTAAQLLRRARAALKAA